MSAPGNVRNLGSKSRSSLNTPILLLLLAVPLAASAQTEDSLEPFLGIWSGVFTTQENEFWGVEDFNCFVGCYELKTAFRCLRLSINPA